MHRKLFIFAALALSTLACNLGRADTPAAQPTPAVASTAIPITTTLVMPFDTTKLGTLETDITYCSADQVALKLNIHYPENADGPWPVVVYVHGGGWTSGDKTQGAGARFFDVLHENGYLIAAVDYRLSPQYKFPAHIEDVKCAIRFLRANAANYNLDADHIGALGGSAGGHLVSLLGTSDASAGFEGRQQYGEFSSRVQAVVDLFGPMDGDVLCAKGKMTTVFGAATCEDEIITAASPLTYISPDDPPFLILQGDQDQIVPLQQSKIFHEALQVAGVSSMLIVVKNAGHGLIPVSGKISPNVASLQQAVVDFFDQYLK